MIFDCNKLRPFICNFPFNKWHILQQKCIKLIKNKTNRCSLIMINNISY